MEKGKLLGPTIQIDPTFAYYGNRSAESIADEIALAGYRAVHYFVVSEQNVNGKLIEAFRTRGLPVWAMVIGNGTFSTEGFPGEWPHWRMGLLKPAKDDGFTLFSPYCRQYVQWKKRALARLVTEFPFDGVEIAEPYLPEWNGLETGVYGDVGVHARAAFRREHGTDIPDFRNPSSPLYYRNDKDRYAAWMDFRVQGVNRYLSEIINGAGGVREKRRNIAVATWSLAVDAGPKTTELLREYHGLDAPSMIAAVKPDIHVLQTHWPDWGRPRLPADYAKRYKPLVRHIRDTHADIPLGLQADIGSAPNMLRSRSWVGAFAETAGQLGYATWTAYEYHIGKAMYEEAPVPVRAERMSANRVRVAFNKRIDPASLKIPGSFNLPDRPAGKARFTGFTVDGHFLELSSESFPSGPFFLEIRNVKDVPDLWLLKGFKANETPLSRVKIPGWRR